MEPKFQTSFIPKKPVISTSSSSVQKVYATNIFSILATSVFLTTVIVTGGLFFYKSILNGQIEQAGKDVNTARDALQIDKIQDLIDANSKIKASKELTEKHIIVSEVFSLLEGLTVRTIRFNKLLYTNNGTPVIAMSGEGQTYNSLIQQGEVFSKSEFLKDAVFSNFILVNNGRVTFDFKATLSTDLISYKKFIEPSVPIN